MGLNEIMKIGNNIKRYRIAKGLSQKEMAEKLLIPYSTYSNYENNNRTPNNDILCLIADTLDVNLNDLFGVNDITAAKSDIYLHTDGTIDVIPIQVSEKEALLIKFYRDLTEDGKEKVMTYIIDLYGNDVYNKNKQEESTSKNNTLIE